MLHRESRWRCAGDAPTLPLRVRIRWGLVDRNAGSTRIPLSRGHLVSLIKSQISSGAPTPFPKAPRRPLRQGRVLDVLHQGGLVHVRHGSGPQRIARKFLSNSERASRSRRSPHLERAPGHGRPRSREPGHGGCFTVFVCSSGCFRASLPLPRRFPSCRAIPRPGSGVRKPPAPPRRKSPRPAPDRPPRTEPSRPSQNQAGAEPERQYGREPGTRARLAEKRPIKRGQAEKPENPSRPRRASSRTR